jgi:hypothetical protein
MMGRESFTLLDHLCGRIGRPDTHKEVYVIGLNHQLHNLPPAFSALLFDKCTTVLGNGATQHRLTALGTPDQVVDDKVDAVFISLVFHVDIVAYNNIVIYKDRLFEGRLKPGKAPNLWGSIPEACGGLKSVSVRTAPCGASAPKPSMLQERYAYIRSTNMKSYKLCDASRLQRHGNTTMTFELALKARFCKGSARLGYDMRVTSVKPRRISNTSWSPLL